jgi:hypothetical protein
MRSTVHLVTAEDCLAVRPLVQPVLDAELTRYRDLGGVDVDAVLAFARELVAERPRSGRELRAALAERFPAHDAADLAYACRNLLAFVQVPPRGVWGRSSQVVSTTAEAWLGRPLEPKPSLDELVMRYLAAFGPATVADVPLRTNRRRRASCRSTTTPSSPTRTAAASCRKSSAARSRGSTAASRARC